MLQGRGKMVGCHQQAPLRRPALALGGAVSHRKLQGFERFGAADGPRGNAQFIEHGQRLGRPVVPARQVVDHPRPTPVFQVQNTPAQQLAWLLDGLMVGHHHIHYGGPVGAGQQRQKP
jgi:hypothetical protein